MKTLRERTQEVLQTQKLKLWVIGKSGQVAKALATELANSQWQADFLARSDLDLEFPDKLPRALDDRLASHPRPDVIINAAAYTQVDRAEKETDLALRINSRSVGELARWCSDLKIPLIHISTDYVFDGKGTFPRKESDPVDPLNAYGRSKLVGELELTSAVIRSQTPYLIFRTSWVYDHQGGNFLTTMLKLGADREELKVVSDQIGAPTYAPHLAQALLCGASALVQSHPHVGVFHFSNTGEISWFEFAEQIFKEARSKFPLKITRVLPIPSAEYPTTACRPANSRFDLSKVQATFGYQIPPWQDGLRECLQRKLGKIQS